MKFHDVDSRLKLGLFYQARQFVPFGYPVRSPPRRERFKGYSHQRRIFAAVHWARLASPADEFPAEHRLAGELLTLPCDQRYGEAEMCRVAEVFLDAVEQTRGSMTV